MQISNLIDDYLKSKKVDYLPYKYSLEEKIKLSNNIKNLINKNFKSNKSNKSSSIVVKNLKANGFFKYPSNYFSDSSIKNIITHLKKIEAYPSHIAYYDKHHPIKNPFNSSLPILSYSIDKLIQSEDLMNIVLSKEIIDDCEDYLGAPPVLFDLNAVITNGKSWKHHETHNLHRDHDDFHHVLLMLYLTDVDENTGPHTYLKKSHLINNSSSKLKPHISNDNRVKDVFDENDKFEQIKMTGKAGTGFLTDANGLHSGQSPVPGRKRVIIWARYGLGKNYMWNVHNHQWWNYNKSLLKKYDYGRILELMLSNKKIKKNLLNDPPMRCTTFYNWNIVVWGKYYYAIPSSLGPFSLEKHLKINSNSQQIKKITDPLNIFVSCDYEGLLKQLEKTYKKTVLFNKIKKIKTVLFNKIKKIIETFGFNK